MDSEPVTRTFCLFDHGVVSSCHSKSLCTHQVLSIPCPEVLPTRFTRYNDTGHALPNKLRRLASESKEAIFRCSRVTRLDLAAAGGACLRRSRGLDDVV
jgi:hypothetical protein